MVEMRQERFEPVVGFVGCYGSGSGVVVVAF